MQACVAAVSKERMEAGALASFLINLRGFIRTWPLKIRKITQTNYTDIHNTNYSVLSL
jgi:hypothetical protein